MNTVKTKNKTVFAMFEDQVHKNPDALALSEHGNRLTYTGLNRRAELIAHKIREASKDNPYIAILLPQGIEFISSVLGTWKSGHVVVPIDIGNSVTQIACILDEVNHPLLLTSKAHFDKIPSYHHTMTVADEDLYGISPLASTTLKPPQNTLAFIIFTSGSTGKPKGVMISHRVLYNVTNIAWNLLEITPATRALAYSSPAFILSFGEYITPLCRGGCTFVPPSEMRQDLDKLHNYINENEITLLSMPTSVAIKMIERPMPSLRWFRMGGEKLIVPINDKKNFKIKYGYGLTETFGISYRTTFDSGIPNNGTLFPGVSICFLDKSYKEVGVGEAGEICIASDTVADGYLNNPELTRKHFIVNPFNPTQTIFRTGDLGYMTPGGELVVTGRADFQVKILGNRIELEQVEIALAQHPAIKQAAVVALEKNESNTLHAFCVPTEGAVVPDVSTMATFLAAHLPSYAFPSQVVSIPTMPMTTSGKVNREALKKIKVEKVMVPLVTRTEQEIAGIWAEILAIPRKEISRTDSIFSLGGNSLQIAQVVTKLQSAPWFLNVGIKHLFQMPRVDEFSALVETCQSGKMDFKGLKETEQPDFEADLLLDTNFPEVIKDTPKGSQNILLTGATGYVGANFLQHVLASPKNLSTVFCIIRAKDNAEARRRLDETLSKYGVVITPSMLDTRVVCIAGDVARSQFSLGIPEYRALCETIDVVYHFAAEVHFFKCYSEMRESNVGGTKSILNFTVKSKIKFLHYISTFSVIGGDCTDIEVLELPDPLFEIKEKGNLDMGYSKSKRVAEKLVWRAIQRGLPAVVYRLGEIGSHSKLSIVNHSDFLARLFIACAETGYYPIWEKKIPYGSIDFACEVIFGIAENGNSWKGKCFHVFENQIDCSDGFRRIPGLMGLKLKEWMTKMTIIIEKVCDVRKQAEYSILLQLMHIAASSSILDKNYSTSNLREALIGSEVNFNSTQNWSRYLAVLLNLEQNLDK